MGLGGGQGRPYQRVVVEHGEAEREGVADGREDFGAPAGLVVVAEPLQGEHQVLRRGRHRHFL